MVCRRGHQNVRTALAVSSLSLAFLDERVYGTPRPMPLLNPAAAQPGGDSGSAREHSHLQHVLLLGGAPLKTRSGLNRRCFGNRSRHRDPVLPRDCSNHGVRVFEAGFLSRSLRLVLGHRQTRFRILTNLAMMSS